MTPLKARAGVLTRLPNICQCHACSQPMNSVRHSHVFIMTLSNSLYKYIKEVIKLHDTTFYNSAIPNAEKYKLSKLIHSLLKGTPRLPEVLHKLIIPTDTIHTRNTRHKHQVYSKREKANRKTST